MRYACTDMHACIPKNTWPSVMKRVQTSRASLHCGQLTKARPCLAGCVRWASFCAHSALLHPAVHGGSRTEATRRLMSLLQTAPLCPSARACLIAPAFAVLVLLLDLIALPPARALPLQHTKHAAAAHVPCAERVAADHARAVAVSGASVAPRASALRAPRRHLPSTHRQRQQPHSKQHATRLIKRRTLLSTMLLLLRRVMRQLPQRARPRLQLPRRRRTKHSARPVQQRLPRIQQQLMR